MTNAQLVSVQWGLFLSVVFILPQLFFRQLTWRSALLTGYFSMLFAAVLLPLGGHPDQAVQPVPFQWVADTFRDGPIAFEQMLLNVALFVPLGAFLWRQRNAVAIGFTLSLAIETTQLVLGHRIFDVDDLMTNTTGTLVGWLAVNWATALLTQAKRGALPAVSAGKAPHMAQR
ncbi:VanZ family protein [Lentzea tibetensis]|uniref:VanZ family protein n=1 Tax=Lentzea tibetensis TaxID=2591470 RepID=A0A563ELU4_9PSEU|nr:VanZ family protein [Lentzea tibetensis]TWP48256.1 VanZ family protein [Lentzea tibetensis]